MVRNSVASGLARQGSRDRCPPLPRREPQADVATAPRSRRDEAHALEDSTSSGSAGRSEHWRAHLVGSEAAGIRRLGRSTRPPSAKRPRGGGVTAALLSSKQRARVRLPVTAPGPAGWQRWSMCVVATHEMPVRIGSRPPRFLSSVGESGGLKSLRRSFDATRNHHALVAQGESAALTRQRPAVRDRASAPTVDSSVGESSSLMRSRSHVRIVLDGR